MLRSVSCTPGEQTPTAPPRISAPAAANLRPGATLLITFKRERRFRFINTPVMSPTEISNFAETPPTGPDLDPAVARREECQAARLESKWQIRP